MSHRSSWLCFSLHQGLEARDQMKRCSQAARNILPGLESADGVDLRDVDDGSQGFQSGAASLADLPRQSVSVKLRVVQPLPYNSPSASQPGRCSSRPSARRQEQRSDVPGERHFCHKPSSPSKATSPPARPLAARNPSELSSSRRLKPVWMSMRFPRLPLGQRVSLVFRAVLH